MTSDLVRTWDNWHRENDAEQRKAWQHWLRMHGITPDIVRPRNAMILRRPERYQIAFSSYANVKLPDGPNGPLQLDTYIDEDGSYSAVPVTTIFQMEAAPLPFPDSSTRTA